MGSSHPALSVCIIAQESCLWKGGQNINSVLFISKAEEIANEGPAYRHGGDGSDGTCDCIGLIIGAIRRAGGQWRGLHGSNYAAREEMSYLKNISSVDQLIPGEVVYKAYEPGQGGYDLPDRYEHGGVYYNGDLRDYYHVGIVESVTPLRIRHMTTPKPKMDTSIGKWAYHGKLKKVELSGDSGGGEKMGTAIIGGGNTDKPIHLRKAMTTQSAIVAEIPQGSEVDVLADCTTWFKVSYAGKTGYVMAQFVTRTEPAPDPDPDAGETVTVSKAKLMQVMELLAEMLGGGDDDGLVAVG